MAQIEPFAAVRYATEYQPELARILTPPYDVITPAMQDEFYERHPRNLVRIDFGKEELGDEPGGQNKYSRAADLFDTWKKEGVLTRDALPAIYVYEQEFDLPGRGRRKRRGFFCAVRLEGLQEGIRAHERTFEGPKADRLNLTRATHSNISPIFCVYQDEPRASDQLLTKAIEGKSPIECEIDDIIHRLWVVDDAAAVADLQQAMADKRLYIADGHHRYETALNYRAEMNTKHPDAENAPWESTLMFLANTYDEGLEILPTHRVLTPELSAGIDTARVMAELRKHFDVEELQTPDTATDAADAITSKLDQAGEKAASFAILLAPNRTLLASLKSNVDPAELIPDPEVAPEVKKLDVTLLHRYLVGRLWLGEGAPEPGHDDILYIKDAAQAVSMVHGGGYEAGFLLNPTRMDQVCEIAGLGMRMPQKSTYFYPKIITGMVIRDMNDPQ